jgi:RIO-like serine/threonine protein kinase
MAKHFASESEFDGKRKRLLDLLEQWQRQHGDEWMPFWRLNRKLPWSSREHEEVRDTLIQQRLIEYKVTSTRGRSGAVYRLPAITATEGTP